MEPTRILLLSKLMLIDPVRLYISFYVYLVSLDIIIVIFVILYDQNWALIVAI